MKIADKIKKQIYVKCKKCSEEIFGNTRKKMIDCKCKAISIDGCEYYIRISGKSQDYDVIKK